MQTPLKLASIFLTALMLFSITVGFVTNPLEESNTLVLEDIAEPSAAASPGHVTFGQYISSDNCPHCYKGGGGSESLHNLKGTNGGEFV